MSALEGHQFFGLMPAAFAPVVLACAAALAAEPGPIAGQEPAKVDASPRSRTAVPEPSSHRGIGGCY